MVTETGEWVTEGVRAALRDSLDLGLRADQIEASTRLLESIVEFDSMAIVTIVLALEARFNITIDDDEIGAESFETFGTLVQLIDAKVTTEQ